MKVILLCAVIWISVVIFLCGLVSGETHKVESRIGHTYVIGTDTVMVIDYSSWHTTYHLSNGNDVSIKLIENLKPIK